MTANVRVHIDRLVLDGLGALDGEAVAAALRTELAHLLTERGAMSRLEGDLQAPRLDAGRIVLSRDVDAAEIGRAVALRIHERLSQ